MKIFTKLFFGLFIFLFFNHNTPVVQEDSSLKDEYQYYLGYDQGDFCAFDQLLDEDEEMRKAADAYLKVLPKKIEAGMAEMQNRFAQTLRIPVVFHITHAGEDVGVGRNIADQVIYDQLETMNKDFSATNSNFGKTQDYWKEFVGSADIKFCLAEIDPFGNPTTGIVRHEYPNVPSKEYIKNTIKQQTFWNTNKYFNVWVVPIPGTSAAGGNTGYAYLPYPGSVGASFDGAVVDYRWIGLNMGTLSHEAGHYLGLFHPWGNGGCGTDDGINDTPTCSDPAGWSYNCWGATLPPGNQSCGNEQMYINFMDYSPSACGTSFTLEQIAVMRATLTGGVANPTPAQWASRAVLEANANTVAQSCQVSGGEGGGGGGSANVDNDVAIFQVLSPFLGDEFCAGDQLTPKVVISNAFGTETLTSARVQYRINGTGQTYKVDWNGSLEKGETDLVELPLLTVPNGDFFIKFSVENPNGTADDLNVNNEQTIEYEAKSSRALPYTEDFESVWDEDIEIVNNDPVDYFEWIDTYITYNGVADSCVAFFNQLDFGGLTPDGSSDMFILPALDLTSIGNPNLTFDLAYSYTDANHVDDLEILLSTTCDGPFDISLKYYEGENMKTGETNGDIYVPSTNAWTNEKISLTQYADKDFVRIAFVNHSGGGNVLWLDNFNIESGCDSYIETNSTNLDCSGTCNGTITVNTFGFGDGLQFNWSDNSLNGSAPTGLCAGNYSVTVIDNSGCFSSASFELIAPDGLDLDITKTGVTAFEGTDGTATANASGGDGNYTYSWSDGQTTKTATNLAEGTYTVTVSDNSGCAVIGDITITGVSCFLEIQMSSQDELTAGGNNGWAAAGVLSGTYPYAYIWSNGETTSSIQDLSPGEYSVTVTDSKGCAKVGNVVISSAECKFKIKEVNVTQPKCVGGKGSCNLGLEFNSGTVDYAWSNGSTGPFAFSLSEGEYSVTVTNGGCSDVADFEIKLDEPTIVQVISIQNVSNPGAADGAIDLSVAGPQPMSHMWSNGDDTEDVTGLLAGIYYVSTTNGLNCFQIDTFEVGTNDSGPDCALLELNFDVSDVCYGENTGSIFVTATGFDGAVSYVWNNNDQADFIYNLEAGTYQVTATHENGCTTTGNAVITENPEIIITVDNKTDVTNGADGSIDISASGGSGTFIYAWSNGQSSQDISNLEPGIYSLNVFDENNCTQSISVEIKGPDCASFNIEVSYDSNICPNTKATVSVNLANGSSVLWSNGEDTATLDLSVGDYSLTVTDADGCTSEESISIGEFDVPLIAIETKSVTCFDESNGQASVAIEGAQVLWDGEIEGSEVEGLASGDHMVKVTDENGCVQESPFLIEQPQPIVITQSINHADPGMSNGSIDLMVSGGNGDFAFLWSNGDETQNIENLSAGSYTVTVTDKNGCTQDKTFEITESAPDCTSFIVEYESSQIGCYGEDNGSIHLIISGANGDVAVTWNDDNLSGEEVTNLGPGTYTASLVDALGCETQIEVEIIEPEELTIEFNTENASAGENNGSATAIVNGQSVPNLLYNWSNGATGQNINNLSEGEYCVTATDSNGCTVEECIQITEGDPDCSSLATGYMVESIKCNGDATGVINLQPEGGNGDYTYDWSNEENGNTIDGLTAGVYTVTIHDGLGCEIVEEIEVTEPNAITISISKNDVTTQGGADGNIEVTVLGGTGDLIISWSNNDSHDNINENLSAGTYSVTIEDENGCTKTEEITINDSGDPDCVDFIANYDVVELNCHNDENAVIELDVSGGNGSYTYVWDNEDNENRRANLGAGTYEVTIEDEGTCRTTLVIVIENPSAILLNESGKNGYCGSEGIASVNPLGGTPNYTYLWDNGSTDSYIVLDESGTYSVVVEDANGCTVESENIYVEVEDYEQVYEKETSNVSCNGGNDGAITIIAPLSENGPYNFDWANGMSGGQIDNLEAGSYSVEISDKNGCKTALLFEITEPPLLEAQMSVTEEADFSISLYPLVTGGITPYSFEWSNGSTEYLINVPKGSYTVTVTDDNGCEEVVDYTSTAVENVDFINNIQIFPNPVSSSLSVNMDMNRGVEIDATIVDILGQTIWEHTFDKQNDLNFNVDVRNFAGGLYFINLKGDNQIFSEKIIIKK